MLEGNNFTWLVWKPSVSNIDCPLRSPLQKRWSPVNERNKFLNGLLKLKIEFLFRRNTILNLTFIIVGSPFTPWACWDVLWLNDVFTIENHVLFSAFLGRNYWLFMKINLYEQNEDGLRIKLSLFAAVNYSQLNFEIVEMRFYLYSNKIQLYFWNLGLSWLLFDHIA